MNVPIKNNNEYCPINHRKLSYVSRILNFENVDYFSLKRSTLVSSSSLRVVGKNDVDLEEVDDVYAFNDNDEQQMVKIVSSLFSSHLCYKCPLIYVYSICMNAVRFGVLILILIAH